MNEIAKAEPVAVQAAPAPADLLQVIAQAVADPRCDVAKMEKLLDMYERIQSEQRKTAFVAALTRVQAKLPQVRKDGRIVVNGQERSRYARLEDIHTVVQPVLAEEGFALSFDEEAHTADETRFIAILSHRDGHSEVKRRTFPTDKAAIGQKGPVRTPIQDAGSTTSYARRHLIKMHLNIVEKDEDNDGNDTKRISDDQAKDIEATIEEVNMNRNRFLVYMGVGDVKDILERDLKKAMIALDVQRERNAEAERMRQK